MSDRIEASSEPWQAIPRAVLRDERLSPAAKGGLVTLLSHEAGWVRSVIAILMRENQRCGREQAQSIMRELVATGYAELVRARGDGGKFSTAYVITADSRSRPRTSSSPPPVEPSTVRPYTVNPAVVVDPQDEHPQDVEPQEPKLAPTRATDPIWDVFVECFGQPTSRARGAWNEAAAVLREYDADPGELRTFILAVRGTDKDWAAVTPNAAAKHFGSRASLVESTNGKSTAASRTHQRAQQLREAGR